MQFPLEWKKAVGFCDGIHNYPSRTEEGFRQLVQETHACWNAVDRLPKKTSGVASDLDENKVRNIGLAAGLVDVKVCAVSDVWSGLKFVRRLKDR